MRAAHHRAPLWSDRLIWRPSGTCRSRRSYPAGAEAGILPCGLMSGGRCHGCGIVESVGRNGGRCASTSRRIRRDGESRRQERWSTPSNESKGPGLGRATLRPPRRRNRVTMLGWRSGRQPRASRSRRFLRRRSKGEGTLRGTRIDGRVGGRSADLRRDRPAHGAGEEELTMDSGRR